MSYDGSTFNHLFAALQDRVNSSFLREGACLFTDVQRCHLDAVLAEPKPLFHLLVSCLARACAFPAGRQLTFRASTALDAAGNLTAVFEIGPVNASPEDIDGPVTAMSVFQVQQGGERWWRIQGHVALASKDVKTETKSTLRVLITEDNAINAEVLRRMLETRGHTSAVATNGQKCLDALAEGNFDAVIMDVSMPVMDGLEATRRIRRAEAGKDRHICIIALTAHATLQDRDRCLEAGVDDYLSKPFASASLFAALDKFFEKPTDSAQAA